MITDGAGRIVEGQSATERLPPASTAVPSPLVFSAGAALPPGDYLLKLAAAEGNRVGTVEHPMHVSLIDGGALQLSDLTVGGPQCEPRRRSAVGRLYGPLRRRPRLPRGVWRGRGNRQP